MILRTLAVAGLMAAALATPTWATVTVPADVWNPANPGDELNVYEIYNQLYGTSFASSADLASEVVAADQVFNFGDSSITVTAIARFAGAVQHFGYYQPVGSNAPVLTELFTVSDPGFVAGPSVTINPNGDFGFYVDPEGRLTGPYIWFSEEALNTLDQNANKDHMILYATPDPSTYLMVWADLPLSSPDANEDRDFNDLVVEITIGDRTVIPEPATMLLLGMGLSTMAIRRIRRKSA